MTPEEAPIRENDWVNRWRHAAGGPLCAICLVAGMLLPIGARSDFLDALPGQLGTDSKSEAADDAARSSEGSAPAGQKKPGNPEKQAAPLQPRNQGDFAVEDRSKTPGASADVQSSGKVQSAPPSGGLFSDDLTRHDQDAPVKVEGDLVTGAREKGELHLKGNVVIRQANAELRSDEAVVYSEPGSTRADRAIAKGHVRFRKEPNGDAPPLKAEAQELEYFVADRRIRLLGEPRLWRGTELIEGKEIFVELDSGAVTIKGARGVIEPKPTEK
jgi:lipopolysaccharide transport protein LptA